MPLDKGARTDLRCSFDCLSSDSGTYVTLVTSSYSSTGATTSIIYDDSPKAGLRL